MVVNMVSEHLWFHQKNLPGFLGELIGYVGELGFTSAFKKKEKNNLAYILVML